MNKFILLFMINLFLCLNANADQSSDLTWCEVDYAIISKNVMTYRQSGVPKAEQLRALHDSTLDQSTQDLYEGLISDAYEVRILNTPDSKLNAVKAFQKRSINLCRELIQSYYQEGFKPQ